MVVERCHVSSVSRSSGVRVIESTVFRPRGIEVLEAGGLEQHLLRVRSLLPAAGLLAGGGRPIARVLGLLATGGVVCPRQCLPPPAGTVQDTLGFLMGVPLPGKLLGMGKLLWRQLRRNRITDLHRLVMTPSSRETRGGQMEPHIRF